MEGTASNLVYYTNRTRVTKKFPKYKGYIQKIGYKALKKADLRHIISANKIC